MLPRIQTCCTFLVWIPCAILLPKQYPVVWLSALKPSRSFYVFVSLYSFLYMLLLFLRDMDDWSLALLSCKITLRGCNTDAVVKRKGDPSNYAYIVLGGSCKVKVNTSNLYLYVVVDVLWYFTLSFGKMTTFALLSPLEFSSQLLSLLFLSCSMFPTGNIGE